MVLMSMLYSDCHKHAVLDRQIQVAHIESHLTFAVLIWTNFITPNLPDGSVARKERVESKLED